MTLADLQPNEITLNAVPIPPKNAETHQEKLRIIMQKGPTILGHIGHKHRKIIANKERSYNIIQPSKT
jgi:hypothetical protein